MKNPPCTVAQLWPRMFVVAVSALPSLLLFSGTGPALAADRAVDPAPSLIISDGPLPPELQKEVYKTHPIPPPIEPSQILGDSYYSPEQTVVGQKVEDLRSELANLQSKIGGFSERLTSLETEGQMKAAEYYANVATISTQLQAGTTPGNPRLVARMSEAQVSLETLSSNVAQLNDLAVEIANLASMASFLLEATRATYSLSGAIEEDHARLAQLEDSVNNTIVVIDRLQNNVNDDITRTAAYLGSERSNLRTLSLAISTGDFFGRSLSNRPFSGLSQTSAQPALLAPASAAAPVTPVDAAPVAASAASASTPALKEMAGTAPTGTPRPLVKIRFDRPDVAYEQPVYLAVNEALERFPGARFELVAVHPSIGNAAQIAIESTRARRNAEKVLRTLTEMGLPTDRIDLSYTPSPEAHSSEVHLYIR